jgi:hypothetical protein
VDIPLVLRRSGPDRLGYRLPRWYRAGMALLLAVLGAGLALGDGPPGLPGWALLVLVALGGLYEDSWLFDAGAGRVVHRLGLCCAARARVIPFAAIERFRLVPLPTGTLLVMDGVDGDSRLIDRFPARRAGKLRLVAERIAAQCGKPLVD